MINKEVVYNELLPYVEEKGRRLDVLLIKSLFEDVDDDLIQELKTYQNNDGGFGHGLEPDVQMKDSSIVCTNVAIQVLKQVRNPEKKETLLKDIVQFFEASYDSEKDGFNLITEKVNDYPHAIWWNAEDYQKNFPYGNPDCEVVGFLFKHRRYLQHLDINRQINNVVSFLLSDAFKTSGFHTLFSALEFNQYVDDDVQDLIHQRLHDVVDYLMNEDQNKEGYRLEPYKVYLHDPHFVVNMKAQLKENLFTLLTKLKAKDVYPDWTWYQYDPLFEEDIKYQWMGYIVYQYIKALRLHRDL